MENGFFAGRLAHTDVLYMQQTTSFMANDFEVTDVDDRPVLRVRTTGSGASRLFMGNRSFVFEDAETDRVLFAFEDVMTWGRDRMSMVDAEGLPLAHLRREMAFFRTRVTGAVVDGTEFEIVGTVWGTSYAVHARGVQIATVERRWAGLARGLMGRSRYEVRLDPSMPPLVRCAVVGTVLGLDLMRAKDQSRSSN
ncbi:LURP-one-related/scramblase family protein [Micrococcus luteus]